MSFNVFVVRSCRKIADAPLSVLPGIRLVAEDVNTT
jgi:hypothetical protein